MVAAIIARIGAGLAGAGRAIGSGAGRAGAAIGRGAGRVSEGTKNMVSNIANTVKEKNPFKKNIVESENTISTPIIIENNENSQVNTKNSNNNHSDNKSNDKKQGDESDSKLKKLRNSLSNKSQNEGNTSWGKGASLYVGIALLAHIIDVVTGFQRPGLIVPLLYIVLVVFILFSVFKVSLDIEESKLIAAVVIAYALPWIHQFFTDQTWKLVISGLIFLFPVLVIYLMFKLPPEEGLHKIARWYVAIWIILIMIWALVNFSQNSGGNSLIKNPADGAKFIITSTARGVSEFGSNTKKSISNLIARATGRQYEGEEENQRGIYLEKLKAQDLSYFTDSRVYVSAELRAREIPGVIIVKNICNIPGIRLAEIKPKEVELTKNDIQTLICDVGQFSKAGSYEVKFISTFMYQTDATIKYYFINKNTYESLSRNTDEDINSKLNIPKLINAVYTGGPMELGLAQNTLPIKLDPEKLNEEKYPFGVSLTNKWSNSGKLIRGHAYILEVPDSISLTSCTRQHEEPSVKDGRKTYVFKINTNNAKEMFDSVSCWIKIDNYDGLVSSGGMPTEQTLIAKAIYEYAIEQSTYVLIEE